MIYVGIDPSLSGCGIAVLGRGKPFLRTVSTESKDILYERVDYILGCVMKALNRATPDTVAICIEEPFIHAKHAHGALGIIGLGYAIREMLYTCGYSWTEVPVSSLKKFATGKGNAGKTEVIASVIKRWGADVKNDNEADAFALAKMAEAGAKR